MAKNWYFKFEYRVWQSDPDLSGCSLAARGFWLEMLCFMYEKDTDTVTGSHQRIARMARCEAMEVERYVMELKHNNVCDVTLSHGEITLVSRRRKAELNVRKQNTLRKQRQRGHASVTVHSKSNSNSNSKKKEEEEGDETPPLPSQSLDLEMEQSPFDHPAVVLYTEKFGLNISRAFAKEIADTVKDLSAWSGLITDKIGYADGTLDERKRISRWFMGAYRERIAAKPVTAKLPSTTEKALSEASARSQLVTPEQMGMSL